jgi:hypothetical protein
MNEKYFFIFNSEILFLLAKNNPTTMEKGRKKEKKFN